MTTTLLDIYYSATDKAIDYIDDNYDTIERLQLRQHFEDYADNVYNLHISDEYLDLLCDKFFECRAISETSESVQNDIYHALDCLDDITISDKSQYDGENMDKTTLIRVESYHGYGDDIKYFNTSMIVLVTDFRAITEETRKRRDLSRNGSMITVMPNITFSAKTPFHVLARHLKGAGFIHLTAREKSSSDTYPIILNTSRIVSIWIGEVDNGGRTTTIIRFLDKNEDSGVVSVVESREEIESHFIIHSRHLR